jgi:hypothetical protein
VSDNDEHVDRLPVNLADVYMICRKSERLISELQNRSTWENPTALRTIVDSLQSELFIHLKYHYESLNVGLKAIHERMLPELTEDELLESIGRKMKDALGNVD